MQSQPGPLPAWVTYPATIVASLVAGFAVVRWLLWDKVCAGMGRSLKVPELVGRVDKVEAEQRIQRGDLDRATGAIEALDGKLANAIERLALSVGKLADDIKPLFDDVQYMRGRFDQEYGGVEQRTGPRDRRKK